jgi:hypothetical protein
MHFVSIHPQRLSCSIEISVNRESTLNIHESLSSQHGESVLTVLYQLILPSAKAPPQADTCKP